MNLFFKICASALSTLALATGITFIVPASRNFILDSVAPYSRVYKKQEEKINELNENYINNLMLLTETRTSLMNAEFKAISYKNEIGVLQNNLLTCQNNLALALNQKASLQTSLDEANKNLDELTIQLSQLREDYKNVNIELDTLKDTHSEDTERISELNKQVEQLTSEMTRLECLIDSLTIASDNYQTKLAEYETQIEKDSTTIEDYQTEIISLKSQIVELQETIKSLESVNKALNGDETYKEIFKQIVGGTVTELKASDLEGIKEIRGYAFYNCQNLQTVELPESVETIGDYAFANCPALEIVTTTSNLKTIGNNAFENCTNLTTINLSNVQYVGSFAFEGTGLTEIHLPSTLSSWGNCIFQNSSIQEVYVEEGVTYIPFGLLHGCGGIKNIYLPKTLKSIDTFGIGNFSSNITIYFAGTSDEFLNISYDSNNNQSFANPKEVIYNYPVPTINS